MASITSDTSNVKDDAGSAGHPHSLPSGYGADDSSSIQRKDVSITAAGIAVPKPRKGGSDPKAYMMSGSKPSGTVTTKSGSATSKTIAASKKTISRKAGDSASPIFLAKIKNKLAPDQNPSQVTNSDTRLVKRSRSIRTGATHATGQRHEDLQLDQQTQLHPQSGQLASNMLESHVSQQQQHRSHSHARHQQDHYVIQQEYMYSPYQQQVVDEMYRPVNTADQYYAYPSSQSFGGFYTEPYALSRQQYYRLQQYDLPADLMYSREPQMHQQQHAFHAGLEPSSSATHDATMRNESDHTHSQTNVPSKKRAAPAGLGAKRKNANTKGMTTKTNGAKQKGNEALQTVSGAFEPLCVSQSASTALPESILDPHEAAYAMMELSSHEVSSITTAPITTMTRSLEANIDGTQNYAHQSHSHAHVVNYGDKVANDGMSQMPDSFPSMIGSAARSDSVNTVGAHHHDSQQARQSNMERSFSADQRNQQNMDKNTRAEVSMDSHASDPDHLELPSMQRLEEGEHYLQKELISDQNGDGAKQQADEQGVVHAETEIVHTSSVEKYMPANEHTFDLKAMKTISLPSGVHTVQKAVVNAAAAAVVAAAGVPEAATAATEATTTAAAAEKTAERMLVSPESGSPKTGVSVSSDTLSPLTINETTSPTTATAITPKSAMLPEPVSATTTPSPATPSRFAISPFVSRSVRRDRSRDHTPRPSNSFIIYRREKHLEIMSQYKGTKTLNNNVISKIVATMWRQESAEVKAVYANKADEEKRVHMLKYPDYKYRPRKSVSKAKSAAAAAAVAAASSKLSGINGSGSDVGGSDASPGEFDEIRYAMQETPINTHRNGSGMDEVTDRSNANNYGFNHTGGQMGADSMPVEISHGHHARLHPSNHPPTIIIPMHHMMATQNPGSSMSAMNESAMMGTPSNAVNAASAMENLPMMQAPWGHVLATTIDGLTHYAHPHMIIDGLDINSFGVGPIKIEPNSSVDGVMSAHLGAMGITSGTHGYEIINADELTMSPIYGTHAGFLPEMFLPASVYGHQWEIQSPQLNSIAIAGGSLVDSNVVNTMGVDNQGGQDATHRLNGSGASSIHPSFVAMASSSVEKGYSHDGHNAPP